MKTLELKKDIYWLGSLDPNLKVFDIIMETEFGTTYNSYLVKGNEKTAVFETVKEKCFDEYLEKLSSITDVSKLDYIVVSHTEPDHAGSISKLLKYAPQAKIVASERAVEFLKDIMNEEFEYIIVDTNSELSLGDKTLQFYSVPFLHWPDTIYTYIKEEKLLITCDSFGSHYSFDEILYSKISEEKKIDYNKALRYYYMAIFSPFKPYLIEALEKIKSIYNEIEMVLPGHGPVLDKNPQKIMEIYREWSKPVEHKNQHLVVIPYVAAYGYTEELAFEIEKGIKQYSKDIEVIKFNINISNFGALKFEILRYMSKATGILFGTSTINGDAISLISELAMSMDPISYGGRYASSFGSYGWSGEGVDNIIDRLDQLRMNVLDGYKIKFKPNEEKLNGAFEFGYTFAKQMVEKLPPERVNHKYDEFENEEGFKYWKCTVCGEVYEGALPPNICLACGVGREYFVGEEKESYNLSHSSEKIIIIGGGVAGLTAAESARKRSKTAKISIIESEKSLPYYRTMLSDYLYKSLTDKELYLKPLSWFEENNINLYIGTGVQFINFEKKIVQMLDGEELLYDKLILANGARCNNPKVKNSDLNGIFTLRSKKDAEEIKKYAKKSKSVVIVGGGVLGLESACAMKELGLEVTIVEMMQRFLPRQLDKSASEMLENNMLTQGYKLYKNTIVVSYEGVTSVNKVILDKERELECDFVIISAGITPNKTLFENKGININRGVVVNSNMETSISGVYACGDIAEYNGKVMGLWDVAIEQGKVAGANVVGDIIHYKEKVQPLIFEGMKTNIVSLGNVNDEILEGDILEEINVLTCDYKKLYFKSGLLDGGILMGDTSKGGILIKGIRNGMQKKDILKKIYN
ncbi:MAG: FAD-dependent oxidoreductase [Fusobacteriaceae bacterium]